MQAGVALRPQRRRVERASRLRRVGHGGVQPLLGERGKRRAAGEEAAFNVSYRRTLEQDQFAAHFRGLMGMWVTDQA